MSGSKKKRSDVESDRAQDEEDFDGTSSSLPDDSVANKKPEAPAAVAPKEKKPRDLSNRPDTYKTMGVQGTSKEYKSDLSKVPGRVLEKKMVPVFHLDVNIVEERFELVHYVEKGKKPKWGYFPVAGNPQIVTKFDGTKVTPIRPLTTQRNAMLHFGSDEGVEMAATYHSIISTVKMQGRSAWEYLGKFFTKSLIKR